jgi:hypothetical protein
MAGTYVPGGRDASAWGLIPAYTPRGTTVADNRPER